MLVYCQIIHCKRLSNNFMCTMHSRMEGVKINELPEFLSEYPDEKTHAIIFSDWLNPNQPLIIPLVL